MESLSKFSIYEPDDIEEIITTTKHNPSGTIRSWNSEIEKKGFSKPNRILGID
jgi:hypothetical protein